MMSENNKKKTFNIVAPNFQERQAETEDHHTHNHWKFTNLGHSKLVRVFFFLICCLWPKTKACKVFWLNFNITFFHSPERPNIFTLKKKSGIRNIKENIKEILFPAIFNLAGIKTDLFSICLNAQMSSQKASIFLMGFSKWEMHNFQTWVILVVYRPHFKRHRC